MPKGWSWKLSVNMVVLFWEAGRMGVGEVSRARWSWWREAVRDWIRGGLVVVCEGFQGRRELTFTISRERSDLRWAWIMYICPARWAVRHMPKTSKG